MLWQILRGLHDIRCLISACSVIGLDTSIILHVLVHCFGSFLLQDMFLSLKGFAFEGQNTNFTVNVLLTCILYCDIDRARLRLELFASLIGRFLPRVSYLLSYVFLRIRRSFTSRKLYTCLEKFLCFPCTIWSSLGFWSSMYRFIPPLIVLVPQEYRIQM